MKLYSRNTGKWMFAFGIGFFAVLLCSVLLFSGLGLNNRLAKASGGSSAAVYQHSLADFTATALTEEGGKYQITSVDALRSLAYYVNNGSTAADGVAYAAKSYVLTTDLDLSGYAYWDPIGTAEHPFVGVFDGAGHSIYGLTIIDESFVNTTAAQAEGEESAIVERFAGLFGYVKYDATVATAAEVKSLGLKDALVKTTATYVGGLIGCAEGASTVAPALVRVSECYVTGYIEGSDYVGGVIGSMEQCARLEYSYFAGSVREEARYLDVIANSEFDVATNVEGGCVGGLAGSAVDDNVNRIIDMCYNAGVVGKTCEGEVIRGALVGYKNDLKTNSLKYNFYLKEVLPGATSTVLRAEGGKYVDGIERVNANFLEGAFDKVNIDCADATQYLPSNPTKTWQWSTKVNNRLPFLKNTPQLVRIEFVTQDANSAEIDSTGITNSLSDGDYTMKIGNTYFVRINISTIHLTSAVTAKSDADYTYAFTAWDSSALVTSVGTTATQPIAIASTPITVGIADKDKVFVVKYTARTYTVNFTDDGTDAADVLSINNNPVAVATVAFCDTLTFSATAKVGYKLSGIVTPSTTDNLVILANGVYTLEVAPYIRALGAGEDVTADTIPALQVMANYTTERYSIYFDANETTCADAPAIVDNANAALSAGAEIAYHDTIYLKIDSTAIAPNYVFAGWKYQIIDSSAELGSDWIAIAEVREDSIGFVVPDAVDGQKFHFRAFFEKKTYTVSLGDYDSDTGVIGLVNSEGDSITTNAFAYDTPVYVRIAAKEGYSLYAVSVNGTEYSVTSGTFGYSGATWDNANSRLTFSGLTENVVVSAQFIPVVRTVSVTITTDNVATTATRVENSLGTSLTGLDSAIRHNQDFAFVVKVETGFDLVKVTANGNALTASSQEGNAFDFVYRVLSDTNIQVVVKKRTFTVNTQFEYNEDSYDYSVDSSCICGNAGTYYYGDTVNLTINLPAMFMVTAWVANGTTFDNTTTNFVYTNLQQDLNITAKLSIRKATVSYSQVGDNTSDEWFVVVHKGISYQYLPNTTTPLVVNYGDLVQFNIADQYFADNGRNTRYTFAYWQVDGTVMTTDRAFSIRPDKQNVLVEAVFRPAQVRITATCYEVDSETSELVSAANIASITGLNGGVASYDSNISLVAQPMDGYRFVAWYDEFNNNLGSSTVLSFKVTKPVNIKAAFVKEKNVAVIINAAEGSVSGMGKTVVGDTVVLTATPSAGYRFVAWMENGVSLATTSEYRFTMPAGDVTLNAVFEKVYAVNYRVNDNALGQVVGNTSGTFKENVTLEAVSANNCSFVGWMIDNVMVSTATKLNLSLNGDVQVEALFKKNFDWNIIIVIVGCGLFALIVVCGAVAFIKSKEARPVNARTLLGGKDDSDIIKKTSKRNALRDEIAPVPTRKQQRVNVQPVPVRKIVVEPTDHKGNKLKSTKTANKSQKTISTDTDK